MQFGGLPGNFSQVSGDVQKGVFRRLKQLQGLPKGVSEEYMRMLSGVYERFQVVPTVSGWLQKSFGDSQEVFSGVPREF